MAEVRRMSTAESSAIGESEDRPRQVRWHELKIDALETIYLFLKLKDRYRMSLVCPEWARGFDLPSVWRKFDFNLFEAQPKKKVPLCILFALKYSEFFRHVRIYCHLYLEADTFNAWGKRLIFFLEILTYNSQLESISFYALSFRCSRADRDISETIVEFLKTQNDLKKVVFEDSLFSYNDGTRILKVLADKSGQSLKCLTLEDFFDWNADNEQIVSDLEEFPRILAFTKLETLKTDYSLILVYLLACQSTKIQKFEQNKTHALSKIVLYHRSFKQEYVSMSEGITSDHWQILTRMFPDLKVEIFLQDPLYMYQHMEFFVMPSMPIAFLNLCYCQKKDGLEIEAFFDHLRACRTNEYLDTLAFQCSASEIPDFDSFVSFVPDCTKLRRLLLYVENTAYAINFIESLQQNRNGSLKDVYIVDTYLKRKPDYPNLMMTFNTISPALSFNLTLSEIEMTYEFIP